MREQIEIREAIPSDAEGIASVIAGSFDPPLLSATIYGCQGIARYVRAIIECGKQFVDSWYVVAVVTGQVIGCAELRTITNEAFLNYIAVRPNCRSAGIGGKLLRFGLAVAPVLCKGGISLDVFDHNEFARNWYARIGFQVVDGSQWWSIPLSHAKDSEGVVFRGWPQTLATYREYGFAQACVRTRKEECTVGLMGEQWYRITSVKVLSDPDLLEFLAAFDSSRRILAILPRAEMQFAEVVGGTLITQSQRMVMLVRELIPRLPA